MTEKREKIEFLNEYRAARQETEQKISELEQLHKLSDKLNLVISQAQEMGDNTEHMKQARREINRLEETVYNSAERLLRVQDEITRAIDGLSSLLYRELLAMRYLNGFTWEKIADILGYSYRHIYDLHKMALNEIQLPKKTGAGAHC